MTATNTKTRTRPYRRKGAGKTDYRKRLRLLKSRMPRLVVRKSLKNIYAQVITFDPQGDRVVVAATPHDLISRGWLYERNNAPAAYLIGLIAGKKAHAAKIKTVIADLGLRKPVKKSILYTVVKGVKDAGVHVPVNDDVLPDQKRVVGEHIREYSAKARSNPAAYQKQFSSYLKKGLNPEDIPKKCEELKAKILKES